jgi:hypothetical protein
LGTGGGGLPAQARITRRLRGQLAATVEDGVRLS